MKRQYSKITCLILFFGVAVACSKKSDDKPTMPPITHNMGQCPTVLTAQLRSVPNGFIMPGFGDGEGVTVDGTVRHFVIDGDRANYQGGCMENTIRLNVYDDTKWIHVMFVPTADGGADVTMNKMGQVETRHFGK